jgi:hypothetical protein
MKFSKTYTLTSQVYLDRFSQSYKNIIMINTIPEGPLKYFVRRIQIPPLSVFQAQNSQPYYPRCGLALTTFRNRCLDFTNIDKNNACFMIPDEIPDLFLFLSDNGYVIDTNITTMMSFSEVKLTNRNIICFFKYIGENV